MKKLFILCLFLQLASDSYGQQYIPFPTDSAYWTTEFYIISEGVSDEIMMLFVNGQDTTINNINYNKLMLRASAFTGSPHYIADDSDAIYGFIREENKKIYFIRNGSENEYLLYDFTLHVGDVAPSSPYSFNAPSPTDTIIGINSTTLSNNITYPTFYANSNPFGVFNNVHSLAYIEGIGSNYGLLYMADIAANLGGDFSVSFICFNNDATQANYNPDMLNCHYIFPYGTTSTAVNNVNTEKEIKIYPNPFTTQLVIESSGGDNACLSDNAGKLILKKAFSGAVIYTIDDLEKYAPGFYYLTVKDNAGNTLKNEKLTKY